jgi:hypothetical protein
VTASDALAYEELIALLAAVVVAIMVVATVVVVATAAMIIARDRGRTTGDRRRCRSGISWRTDG